MVGDVGKIPHQCVSKTEALDSIRIITYESLSRLFPLCAVAIEVPNHEYCVVQSVDLEE